MSTYYKESLGGAPIYRIAAARVTYEKADGTIGELNLAGGGGGSVAWADITGKPAVIAAGADQAAARTAIGAISAADIPADPTWTTISGKPAVVAAGTTQATARTSILAAASGANSDITQLSGLTTALSAAQGGTGVTSIALLANALNIEGFMPGLAPSISNLDTWTIGGIRCMTTSTVGRPTGTVTNDLVFNLVSATLAAQFAFLSATTKLVFRVYNGSAWSAWQLVTNTAL